MSDVAAAKRKFSNRDLYKLSIRWCLNRSIGFNYEKMMATGYLATMMPVLRRLYDHDEDALSKAYRTHNEFFNCENNLATIIMGLDIAMEEKFGAEGLPMAASLKAALMGPFSGIGDTLFSAVIGGTLGAIAVQMGLEGNITGWLIWWAWDIFTMLGLKYLLMKMAYEKGTALAETISDKLKLLTECGGILGLTVIGCMIASLVKVKFGVITLASVQVDLQAQLFDPLIPKFGCILAVFIIYKLLGNKKIKTTYIFAGIIAISIICAYLGILVK